MEESEALEVLGLTNADDAAQVKKAYRRLLRGIKPDQDPEGFKRLRTAYETLKHPAPVEVAALPVNQSEIESPARRKSSFELQLEALGTGPDNALRRIYLLDAATRSQPADADLLQRLIIISVTLPRIFH